MSAASPALPNPDTLPSADQPAPAPVEPEALSSAALRRGAAALNATAIVVLALYFGRDLLVPLVLAVLLAFVLAPLVSLLQRARIGRAPAVLAAVALAVAVIGGIGTVVGGQAASLAGDLPKYQATIQDKVKSLTLGAEVVARLTSSAQAMLTGQAPGTPPGFATPPPATPAAAAEGGVASTIGIVRSVASPLFGPLATIGVVMVFVIFVLLYREDLRDRLVRLVGRQDLHRTILAMNDAARRLSRYFLFQLGLNVGFGLFITAGLFALGLPSPVLWGIIAALMRFVPYIGSVIAVVFPFLVALAVAPGWSLALLVLGLFLLGDMIMGQIIEPLMYGHSTGLSPIAVILSAAFWVFMWGPVGLLIATPLTVCLVVAGRYVPPLAFLDVMLGDSPPLTPPETFYQRALEGAAADLAIQANRMIAGPGKRRGVTLPGVTLADYYDRVALRGLALAQADLSRDALAFERLEAIHVQIEALLRQLDPRHLTARQLGSRPGTTPPAAPPAPPPHPAWQAPGAVVCIPARGQLDDLAATMALQVLQGAGFGARQEGNAVLGASQPSPPGPGPSTGPGNGPGTGQGSGPDAASHPVLDLGAVRLCCLSVLDQGSTASGLQYLLRRIHRRMPAAVVVVGLWHAAGDSALLTALRAEGSEETIVLSLGELVALARAVAAREPAAALPAQPPST